MKSVSDIANETIPKLLSVWVYVRVDGACVWVHVPGCGLYFSFCLCQGHKDHHTINLLERMNLRGRFLVSFSLLRSDN